MGGKPSKRRVNSITVSDSMQINRQDDESQPLIEKKPFVTIKLEKEKEMILEDIIPENNFGVEANITHDVQFIEDKTPTPTDQQILNAFVEETDESNKKKVLVPILANSAANREKIYASYFKCPIDQSRSLLLSAGPNQMPYTENVVTKKKMKGVRFSEQVLAVYCSGSDQIQIIPIKSEDSETRDFFRSRFERERYGSSNNAGNKLNGKKTHQNLGSLTKSWKMLKEKSFFGAENKKIGLNT